MLARESERREDLGDESVVDRTRSAQRGRGEGEPFTIATNRDQPDPALLHDVGPARRPTRSQPRMGRSERGVAGEGKFATGCEDTQPVVGGGVTRRLDERGLGEVGPARERGHRILGHPIPIDDDGNRVAAQRFRTEHVDLGETSGLVR